MLQRRLPNTRLGEESTAQDEGCLQVSGAPPPSASRHPIGRPDALNAPISLGGVNASGQAPVVIGSACLVSILVTVLLRRTRTAPACRLWPRRRQHAPGCLRARRDMSSLRQLASDHISPLGQQTMVTQTGETWDLVFSDEFDTPGRTFWPGGRSQSSTCVSSFQLLLIPLRPWSLPSRRRPVLGGSVRVLSFVRPPFC
jgi:hypothetical protein